MMRQVSPADAAYAQVRQPGHVNRIRGKARTVGRPDRALLLQLAVSVVPAMALTGIGRPNQGAAWFFALLVSMLCMYLLLEDRYRFVCLAVGAIPGLMLLRQFFFYSSPVAILALGVGFWAFKSPAEAGKLWKNGLLRNLLLLGVAYWLASYIDTGDYSTNIRVLEAVLSVACVYLLSKRREMLGTAMLGIAIGVFSMGMAFLPHSERLGMAKIGEGHRLGNPISFGLPLALILLLAIADNGRWLMLEKKKTIRLALVIASSVLLLLSTSRGSIAVVAVGLVVLALLSKRDRGLLVASLVLMALATAALLATDRGKIVEDWTGKTFSSDRTASQISSGRSDQWLLFPVVLRDSPLFGFGPGTGRKVYARYSYLDPRITFVPGEEMDWHSLFLQIGVECGIAGLGAVLILLVFLTWRTFIVKRASGELAPLVCLTGFVTITASVSGLDCISGVFMGLAFYEWRKSAPRLRRNMVSTAFAPVGIEKEFSLVVLSRSRAIKYWKILASIDTTEHSDPWGRDEWLMDLPGKWRCSWLLLRKGVPVGFVVGSRKGDALHLHRLAVSSTEKGKGLGNLLMGAAAWRAVREGCRRITFKVHERNTALIEWYGRLGYENTGRQGENFEMTGDPSKVRQPL